MTVTADGNGNWTYTPGTLPDGPHQVTVSQTDGAGKTSDPTVATVAVDTTAPSAPAITAVTDEGDPIANGATTNDTTPTLSGTGEAGATVTVYDNGVSIGTTTVAADGSWTFTPAAPLSDGSHVFTAGLTDAAGNASAPSPAFGLAVDSTAPAAPVIATLTDDAAPATGNIPAGGTTNDTTPTIAGTTEPGSTVNVYDGTTLIGTVTADGAGNWTLTPTLVEGNHSLTATTTDAAGNTSGASTPFAVTVDTTAPAASIAVTGITDDTGVVGDWVTGDTTPIFSGTLGSPLGSGETVQVSLDGGATWSPASVNGTNWSWFAPGQLADGGYTLETRVVDNAGNVGNIATQTFTIAHNVAPEAGVTVAGGLLGIADANVLGLIDLSQQQFFTASDYNDNIQNVVLHYGGLGGILSTQQFDANLALAAELGLQFTVTNNPGILGLGASSDMTITALDGGPIDNLKLNEFLASITLDSGGLAGTNVDLLNSISITATDSTVLTGSATAGQLLSVGVLTTLLDSSQSSSIIEGTSGNDTVTGTAGNDRLYGYAGDDTLDAGDGNDLLRGGAGNDVLLGGAGNDILIGGSGNDTLTGGAGGDVFLWEVNAADNGGGNGTDVITDFTVAASPDDPAADRLDVSHLLVGYQADADGPAHYVNGTPTIDAGDTIANYLTVTNVGGNTVVTIDRDGSGTAFAPQTLVTLNNVTTNLETLLANHQIVV